MTDVHDTDTTASPPVIQLPAQPPAESPAQLKSKYKEPFALTLRNPYETFKDGKPLPIPCVIDGLLTQGGFSILAGKPKLGKSSMSRYEAVCVAKGLPFLGRGTTKGDVLLISLEDSINHVDNCLMALGYDPTTDARIWIVDKLAPSINDSINAIDHALALMPNARLVIIDTLAKLIRVRDINDYSDALDNVEKVHNLARKFPQLHIQGLAHCKKVQTDNPFDSLLGSTALRGETDTTIALYEQSTNRLIAVEARQGRKIDPTILTATIVESAGANVVQSFSLGQPLAEWQAQTSAKKESKRKETCAELIIQYLRTCSNSTALRTVVLNNVNRNNSEKIGALEGLIATGTVKVTGEARNPMNPLTLHLDENSLLTHDFVTTYRGSIQ